MPPNILLTACSVFRQMGALLADRRIPAPMAVRAVGRSGRNRAGPDGADKGRAGAGHPADFGHRQGRGHVVGYPLCRTPYRRAKVQGSKASEEVSPI